MTRRVFILLPVTIATAQTRAQTLPNGYPATPENIFAVTYNNWAKLHVKELESSGLDIQALKAFKDVEKAFRKLRESLAY